LNSALLLITGILAYIVAYLFYSKWISRNLFSFKDNLKTPAHQFYDGVDYFPTPKKILIGHHFTSIAGAAPIIGPCIAAYWGWLPAFLWIVLGTIFIGAVHDFGALVISLREKGKTIADISSFVISKNARIIFLIFIMMLGWLVLSVFAMAIADLFVTVPTTVVPINIQIILAIIVGFLIYKKNVNTVLISIVSLIVVYFFVWIGTFVPVSFEFIGFTKSASISMWILILFLYSAIASLLPVWVLLQPRDFINSNQLILGIIFIFVGVFLSQPSIEAPILRIDTDNGAPPLFPFFFITIACGAISGFHGLIASGTTSKQVKHFRDARDIGFGSMLGEGSLALASLIAAVAGISLVSEANLPSHGLVKNLSWHIYYDSWAHASMNKATAFVLGGGALIQQLGFSVKISNTIIAVLVIAFAATTLDTVTRIQRFVLSEIGFATNISWLKNRFFSTLLAITPALILSLIKFYDPQTGSSIKIGWVLWPIFGMSNQMLAGLTLMVLTIYFYKKNKSILPIFIPMIFIFFITFISLIIKSIDFFSNNIILFIINIILICLVLWMIFEGFKSLKKNL